MKSITSGHPRGVPWCRLTEVLSVLRLVLLTMGRKLKTRSQLVYDENVVTALCHVSIQLIPFSLLKQVHLYLDRPTAHKSV